MEHKIKKIKENSIAKELDIHIGDSLIEVNGKEMHDILEYLFEIASDYIELTIKTKENEVIIYEIEKQIDEKIGLEFENPILDKPNTCKNKCIFCFVDQLPKGMRKPLYFKDDDSRLGFLHGNYITLTNLSEEDIKRIIDLHISPINISIHTTNPELRLEMVKNPKAADMFAILKRFTENGININGQIVLCPGFNDGKELDRTISDLSNLGKYFNNLAIVPVGLSKYREGLETLKPVTKEIATRVINKIEKYQTKFLSEVNYRFCYLSDEFYITANKEFPQYDEYDGFPQIENGVGLTVKFNYEIENALKKYKTSNFKGKITIFTGVSAYENMNKLKIKIEKAYKGLYIDLVKIRNNFFGEKITVTGLITGGDIIKQVNLNDLGEKVFVPEVMLKDGEDRFLDDVLLTELENKLNRKITITEIDGFSFIKEIIKEV